MIATIGLILAVAYFLPTAIALGRSHHLLASIFVINLFLGWTLIGWVVALALAVSPVKANDDWRVLQNAGFWSDR